MVNIISPFRNPDAGAHRDCREVQACLNTTNKTNLWIKPGSYEICWTGSEFIYGELDMKSHSQISEKCHLTGRSVFSDFMDSLESPW